MNRRTVITLFSAAILGSAIMGLDRSAQAFEPTIAGTWELNVAASKSTGPLPKSAIRTYEVIGNSEKMTTTVVTGDGKTITSGFTATLDGNDSPSTNPGVDTVVLIPVDALTVNYFTKLAGKVVYSGSRFLSNDGKIMTLTVNGLNPAGKPMAAIMVFDRR